MGFIALNWRGMKISRLPEKLRCGRCRETGHRDCCQGQIPGHPVDVHNCPSGHYRSEEHTSELQSLMRISYAVFCLKKKKHAKKASTNENHKYKRHITSTHLAIKTQQLTPY